MQFVFLYLLEKTQVGCILKLQKNQPVPLCPIAGHLFFICNLFLIFRLQQVSLYLPYI